MNTILVLNLFVLTIQNKTDSYYCCQIHIIIYSESSYSLCIIYIMFYYRVYNIYSYYIVYNYIYSAVLYLDFK